MLRKLVDIIVRPLFIIYEWLWQSGEDWRNRSVTPIFKKGRKEDLGNDRLVSLALIPGNMEQLILETISRHVKDKKGTKNSQNGFTKVVRESYLTT